MTSATSSLCIAPPNLGDVVQNCRKHVFVRHFDLVNAPMSPQINVYNDFRLAVVGDLVHDLKDLVVESFAIFQVKYMPRACNRVV